MKRARLTLEFKNAPTVIREFAFFSEYDLGLKMWDFVKEQPTRPIRLVLEFP